MVQEEILSSIQAGKRVRWTTIKVPVELREFLSKLSEKEGKPVWRIVLDSASFYWAQKQKPRVKEDASLLDKVSWYIAKVAMSVGELKASPSQENLERLRKTAAQIQERLGVDTSLLIRAAEAFLKDPNTDNRMELNAATKMLVLDIILKRLVEESEKS